MLYAYEKRANTNFIAGFHTYSIRVQCKTMSCGGGHLGFLIYVNNKKT